MAIGAKIRELHASLPQGVSLVAVSKFHPVEAVMEAYEAVEFNDYYSKIDIIAVPIINDYYAR